MNRAAAERLAEARLSPRRLGHSRRVAALAAAYARRWGASPAAAELAGLLHDVCRELPAADVLAAAQRYRIPVGPIEALRPVGLLHAPVAAAELAEAGVDGQITTAIARHTLGAANMSILDKCVYLADLCEPGRVLDGLDEIRRLAEESLDGAMAAAASYVLLGLIERGRPVVPRALEVYNEYHAIA